jgi:uncharacterized membrane protein YhaH (DUF805 family)
MKWFIGCLKRYADFTGRAGRAEFWSFFLVYIVGTVLFGIIDYEINTYALVYVWTAALLVPYISVGVRRMHDLGFSGLLLLIALIPFCAIAVLIMAALPSKPTPNKYGHGPRILAEA